MAAVLLSRNDCSSLAHALRLADGLGMEGLAVVDDVPGDQRA